jgi:hypothetical protein
MFRKLNQNRLLFNNIIKKFKKFNENERSERTKDGNNKLREFEQGSCHLKIFRIFKDKVEGKYNNLRELENEGERKKERKEGIFGEIEGSEISEKKERESCKVVEKY